MNTTETAPVQTVVEPQKLVRRHFYRCTDCLTVVALEETLPLVRNQNGMERVNAVCDSCEGSFEYMGKTKGLDAYSLRQLSHYACVCDGKCTNALGPNCDCVCGGKNHGSKQVVAVYKDCPVPRVLVPKDASVKAVEYRRLVSEVRQAYEAKYGEVNKKKSEGEYIGNFNFYLEGQYDRVSFNKARSMRTHKGRNTKLTALLESLKK